MVKITLSCTLLPDCHVHYDKIGQAHNTVKMFLNTELAAKPDIPFFSVSIVQACVVCDKVDK